MLAWKDTDREYLCSLLSLFVGGVLFLVNLMNKYGSCFIFGIFKHWMKWWQSSQSHYERTDGPATHASGHKIISDMMQLWLSKILLQSQKYITSLKEGNPLYFFFDSPADFAQSSACVCHPVDKDSHRVFCHSCLASSWSPGQDLMTTTAGNSVKCSINLEEGINWC